MKKLYIGVLLCTFSTIAYAQLGSTFSYIASPVTNMQNLSSAHGAQWNVYYRVKKSPYQIGVGWSSGTYGYNSSPLIFTTTDGSILNTTVEVYNSFNSIGLYQRFQLAEYSGRITPFFDLRTGGSFFRTRIYIADPEDESNCEPLEQEVIQKDQTWSAYAGTGVDIRLCGLLNKKHHSSGFPGCFLTLGFGYMVGGKVSYMNVDDNTPVVTQQQHVHPASDAKKSAYYTTFVNTQTQVVHEHHTGYLYTSSLRMMQMHIGFSVRF